MFAAQGKAKGFDIQVVVQPAQSPDLNVDHLVFFHSLQTDVSLVAKEARKELLQAVETCWHEYPTAKMRSVKHCLCGSFHGILESGGDNNYQRHRGGRQAHRLSEELGNLHDQIVSRQLVKAAEQKLTALAVKVSERQTRCHQRVSHRQITARHEEVKTSEPFCNSVRLCF